MKITTTASIGIAAALLIAACVAFEDRIASVTTPDFAAVAVTAGCTGGREFIEAATMALDPAAAALIVKGVETACALRSDRNTISATIYNDPLDSFCAETDPLAPRDATLQTRAAFNASRTQICEARP